MTPIESLHKVISQFEGVNWANFGDPKPNRNDEEEWAPGWVKFGIEKNELGWRTLEFMAWAFEDLVKAKYRLFFFPTSPPPYLNEPGECLSFVVECYIDTPKDELKIEEMAQHLNKWFVSHWPSCKPE